MIVEWFVAVAIGLFGLVVSAMGTSPAPGWLTGLSGQMDSLVAGGASMGVWVPWGVFGPAVAAVVACAAISLVVRLVRMGLSLFTGGGGSAA